MFTQTERRAQMVTRLDIFIVRSALERVSNGKDKTKAEAAFRILNDGLLMYEYTRLFIEKRKEKKRSINRKFTLNVLGNKHIRG